jgi:hypothetical protein
MHVKQEEISLFLKFDFANTKHKSGTTVIALAKTRVQVILVESFDAKIHLPSKLFYLDHSYKFLKEK